MIKFTQKKQLLKATVGHCEKRMKIAFVDSLLNWLWQKEERFNPIASKSEQNYITLP